MIFLRYCGSKLFNMTENIMDVDYVLTQTEGIVSNAKFLKVLINDCNFNLDEHLKIRLSKWSQFFNVRYHVNFYINSNTIYVLFDSCHANDMFKLKAEHEFEQSLRFYDTIYPNFYINLSYSIFYIGCVLNQNSILKSRKETY